MLFKPSAKTKTKAPQPEAPRRSIPSTILFGDQDDINDLRLAGCGLGSLAIGSTTVGLSTVVVDPAKHIGVLGYHKDKLDLLEFLTYQYGVFAGSVIFFDCNGSQDLIKNLKMQNPSGVSFHEGRVEYAISSPTPILAFKGVDSIPSFVSPGSSLFGSPTAEEAAPGPRSELASSKAFEEQTIAEAFYAINDELLNLEFSNEFDASDWSPTLLVISNLRNFLDLVSFKDFMNFMRIARRYKIGIVYELQPDMLDKDLREDLLANSGSLVCFNTSSDNEFTERMAKMNTTDNSSMLRALTTGECLVWTSENMFIPTKVKIPQLID